MSKNPHERKRKEKLAAQRRRERDAEPLVYEGNKYKKGNYVEIWLHTETGILQAYADAHRKLYDKTVYSAIEKLIRAIRSNKLPPLDEAAPIHLEPGKEEDFLIEMIRRTWKQAWSLTRPPVTDDLIGVLRSLLYSIENLRSGSPYSQGYLKHIEGFLAGKVGLSVNTNTIDGDQGSSRMPPQKDELLDLGYDWIDDDDRGARAEFFELADQLMKGGQSSRVHDVCSQLVAEISDPKSPIVNELMGLVGQAHRGTLGITT